MYKTWTFPRIRPLILPLTTGSEKQQVKKKSHFIRGVFEAKNCGKKYKDIVVSSPLFVFQYISASCMNYSVGRNFSLFS